VLLVLANPAGTETLRLQEEERAIREAIQLSKFRDSISVKALPAATVDDLRRELLHNEYEILHFSGHGDRHSLLFETAVGEAAATTYAALAAFVQRYPSIACVILNACFSLADIEHPLTKVTIGMEAPVADRAAIEFVRGFYDAVAAGKDWQFAVEEGESNVKLKGLADGLPLKYFT
jgi:hypothetical protein